MSLPTTTIKELPAQVMPMAVLKLQSTLQVYPNSRPFHFLGIPLTQEVCWRMGRPMAAMRPLSISQEQREQQEPLLNMAEVLLPQDSMLPVVQDIQRILLLTPSIQGATAPPPTTLLGMGNKHTAPTVTPGRGIALKVKGGIHHLPPAMAPIAVMAPLEVTRAMGMGTVGLGILDRDRGTVAIIVLEPESIRMAMVVRVTVMEVKGAVMEVKVTPTLKTKVTTKNRTIPKVKALLMEKDIPRMEGIPKVKVIPMVEVILLKVGITLLKKKKNLRSM